MGKVKKIKRSGRKSQLNNGDTEEEIIVDSKESAIQTILDQLQSVNIEEKYCALQTLAIFIETPENIEQVIENDLVKVVGPLLLDKDGSVRNAAAGVLRNLTNNMDSCDPVLEQDIMTPLNCYFDEFAKMYALNISSIDSKTKNENADTFIHCAHLLINLCEGAEVLYMNQDKSMDYINASNILDIFSQLLDVSTFGTDIVISILKCLYVIVEDNYIGLEKIVKKAEVQIQNLMALEGSDPAILVIKTYIAGIILSSENKLSSLPIQIFHQIILIFKNTLSVDHRLVCNQLSSILPLSDGSGKPQAPSGKDAQTLESQLKSVSQLLDAQQTTIEIVTNLCYKEEDSFEEDGLSANRSAYDPNGTEFSDSEEESDDYPDDDTDKLPTEILEAIISQQILEKVWAKTQLPAENVLLILKEYEGSQLLYKSLQKLQTVALLCINNLIGIYPFDRIGGVNGLYKIWLDAGKLVFKLKSKNVELFESATAVMRASLDKMKKKQELSCDEIFKDLAATDIEVMLTAIRDSEVPEIRANLLRMTGSLAALVVGNQPTVFSTITNFLLEHAHKENVAWVMAEALDTLMDLYSEKEDFTIEFCFQIRLDKKLEVFTPILKNKARQQKQKMYKEHRVLVSTVLTNLPRFIKYIRSKTSND